MIKNAKKFAFGLAVTLGFFLIVEGILWISGVVPLSERADPYVGFSGYSPLFVERKTPDGEDVFATANAKLNWFNYQQFPVSKASGVTRIFCLGGSTTYGRPYDDRTSFCGWLRAFLPAVDPNRQWEVINAGGISYASYRVVRLMEALVRHEPDLFIIYTGHNEFLEKRTYDRLLKTPEFVRDLASFASRLRLYSLLSKVTDTRDDVLATEVEAVLDNSVGPEAYHRDDAMRDAVLEHFRASIERMIRIGQQAGAGIIFVTPASNIGDFSPFKAEPSAGLDAACIHQVGLLKESITESLDEHDSARASDLTAQALAIDPRDAELSFLQGKALSALGQIEEARRAFIAARDEDIAPLRALTPMLGMINDVARENGTGLVDFARMIEDRSEGRIPGEEFFLDHVHPSIEANRMLALALVDEMIRIGAVASTSTWSDAVISEITEHVKSGVDEAANAMALTNLSRVLTWAGKQEEALRLVDRAMLMTSDYHTLFQKATVLVRAGRYEEALPYSAQAARMMPKVATVRRAHGILLAELGRNIEAREELETAARLEPTMLGLYYHLGLVLSHLGHKDQAERTYRKALELEPKHANACNNLGILLANRGDLEAAIDLFERAVGIDPRHPNAVGNLEHVRRLLGR
jgi:tetratricopeptide (TPR) repeat protein